MIQTIFSYPISKTRYWEGQLHVTAQVADEQVNIQEVILEDKFRNKTNITNCLEKHGFCREEITYMAINDAPEWDGRDPEDEDVTMAMQDNY